METVIFILSFFTVTKSCFTLERPLWCDPFGKSCVAFPVYNGIAYWTAMPVKVDENYRFGAQWGGASVGNQARGFGYNIRPVADR